MHSIYFNDGEKIFFETNNELKNFLFSIKENNLEYNFEIFIDTKLTKNLKDYLSIIKIRDPKVTIPNEISNLEEIIEYFDIINFYQKINDLSF
tara:strand:+ start:3608 stop:3886 length:279 start_codon:yes stop_codon:yes gene_type:complete